MRYSNIDFNVVYVDPSKSSSGDGTTPAKALNALPSTAAAFADNTCYLIRRTAETAAAVIPNGTNSSIKNLMLMGMPNASDELWEIVPAEAKSAWGGDSAEYANVQSTASSGSFAAPNAALFLLHRVYLFRDGINADQYILKFQNNAQSVGCYAFEHCKFGSRGINVDKTSYAAAVTASRLKSYVYVYYARVVDIRDCVVNHALTGNTNNPCGIYCYFADIMNVQDVRVYSPLPLRHLPEGNRMHGAERPADRPHERHVGDARPDSPLRRGIRLVRRRGRRGRDGDAARRGEPGLALNRLRDPVLLLRVRDLPEGGEREPPERVVREVARPPPRPLLHGELRPRRRQADRGRGDRPRHHGGDRRGVLLLERHIDARELRDRRPRVHAERHDDVPEGPGGDGAHGHVAEGQGALHAENVRLTDATLEGTVILSYVEADINSIKTWFPGKALYAQYGTHARVRRMEANLANAEYPYNEEPLVFSTYDSYGSVFVDESNAGLAPMAASSSRASHIYQGIGCNNEGAAGHFAFRCQNGLCDTWSVRRTGGGTAALKLTNNTCSGAEMMVLGRRPFNGMQLTPTTTGRHMLRAHVAFKGFAVAAELYRQFIISATRPSAGAGRTIPPARG